MIERAPHTDDRFSGRARGAIASLAFGVGHGCFTDRFAGHDFYSEALRYDIPAVGDGSAGVAFAADPGAFRRSFISADLRR